MAKSDKTKRISITTFEKIMKETYTPTTIVEWNGVEITVKKSLSFVEMLNFVDSVTKSCFTSDHGTYLPEVKEFAVKCCVLEMYANFAMPSNIERKYDLVYCTDAFDIILEHIDIRQFNEIINAINDKVDNIAQANIEAVNRQMNELYSAFNTLQEQLGGIFSGVNSDEIHKLVGAISNGQFDEEKLVRAYIKKGKQAKEKDGE